MNAIIAKESRPLVLPWSVGAVAAVLISFNPSGEILDSSFILFLATFAWAVCLGILCCVPFGVESQQRTFQLLLSQPFSRARVWRDKMVVLGVAVVTLCLLLHLFRAEPTPLSVFLVGFLLVSSVCSAGVWIGRSRLVIPGLVAGIATQIFVFSILNIFVRLLFGSQPLFWIYEQRRTLVMAGLIYSGLFVWLGWHFWKTRLLKLGASVAGVLIPYGFGVFILGFFGHGHRPTPDAETIQAVTFTVAMAFSGCFWTLTARSTLGGLVFSVASILITGSVGAVVIAKANPEFSFESRTGLIVTAMGGLAYSILFLWLGWRKFARLELRDSVSTERNKLLLSVPWLGGKLVWLRCRRKGALANLVRKELRLQRPLVTIATIFTVSWLVLVALRAILPAWRSSFETLFFVIASLYCFLELLLAGAISLGEEKLAGLAGWHLTLPVKCRSQWGVKLVVSMTAGVLLGIILPFICLWLTLTEGPLHNWALLDFEVATMVLLAAVLVLTISFWTAALATNTLRSLIGAMGTLAALFTACQFSNWVGSESAHSQRSGFSGLGLSVWLLVLIATALVQSFLLFRRPQAHPRAWLKQFAILLAVAVLMSAWCATF